MPQNKKPSRHNPNVFKPLVRVAKKDLHTPKPLIEEVRKAYPLLTEAGAQELLDRMSHQCEYWVNDIYQVQVLRNDNIKMAWINIRRRDGQAVLRDWRHFQAIKNQLIGNECEAVELYPAESRKQDTANRYHLYASTDPAFRFPFGEQKRNVRDDENTAAPGLRQRPRAQL